MTEELRETRESCLEGGMMRRTTAILVALVVLLAMAVPASAKTDRIPFSGEDHLTVLPHGGTSWISEDGVLHMRGSMSTYDASSDSEFYNGVAYIVVNFNMDLATGQGRMWGTNHIDVVGYDGGFTGKWIAWFTETGWEGRGHSKGYGELDGYQQRYDLESALFGDYIEGFTFMPGNKN